MASTDHRTWHHLTKNMASTDHRTWRWRGRRESSDESTALGTCPRKGDNAGPSPTAATSTLWTSGRCTLQDQIIFHCTLQHKIIILHCTLQHKIVIFHCTLQHKIIIFPCTLQHQISIFHCILQDKIIIFDCTLQHKIFIFHCTLHHKIIMCVCVCACVCVCLSVCTCVCGCVHACVHVLRIVSLDKILHFITTLIINYYSHLIKLDAFWPVVSSWLRAQCSRWRRWPWGRVLPRTRLGCPASTPCGLCQRKSAPGTNHDRFYTVPLSALQLTHCTLAVWDSKWVIFCNAFWTSTKLVYLQRCLVVAWLMPCETVAVLVHVLCTLYNHAPVYGHFIRSHMCGVHPCLFVTCHLHFWQNDQDLLRDDAEIHGWNGSPNESAQKVDPGEENSSTTPQTLDPSILRLELHTSELSPYNEQTNMGDSSFFFSKTRQWTLLYHV